MFRNVSAKRKGAALVATAASAVLLMTGCSASGSGSSGGSGSGSASDTLVAYTGQAGDYQINFNPYSPSTIGGPGEIFEPLFYYNPLAAIVGQAEMLQEDARGSTFEERARKIGAAAERWGAGRGEKAGTR